MNAQCDDSMAMVVQRPRPLSAATDLTDSSNRTSQAIEADVCSHLNRFPAYPTTRIQLTESFVQPDNRSLSEADFEAYTSLVTIATCAHID